MKQLNQWPHIPSTGRRPKYDYDRFLDGNIYECKRGIDFTCKRQSFMTTMRKAAIERGLKFRYANSPTDADTIIIQAFSPQNPS